MGQRRIVDEAQRLAIVISAAIVVCMELFQVAVSGGAIKKELIDSAERSATEISRILEFPLYTLDNDQAQRIGEVMLASRRVSGITIRDSEGNAILDRRHSPPSRRIPSITRAVQREGLHLGVVYLEFSDAELDNSIRRSLWTTLSVILGIVLANIIAFRYIFTLRIAKPFASIVAAIGRIGKGDYDGAVPRSGYGDVDLLIDRFNHMAAAVKEKSLQLKEANDLLESRVEERTRALESSLEELRKLHERLVETEKLSALGHLAAGVTHELNTPLGAIASASAILSDYFAGDPDSEAEHRTSLTAAQEALSDRLLRIGLDRDPRMGSGSGNRSKRKSALAVLEREGVPAAETISGYLSDMGMEDLAAELAPELLAEGSLEAVKRAWDRVQAKRMAAVIGIAARKAASVVEALKSHLENERTDGPAPIMLRESIQAAIALLSDELKGSAETKVDIGDQLVLGYPDSLGQVWMNLVKNSLQAMGGSGVLLVRAETRDSMVRVSFRDNGPGIDPETQSRLLDPYFSTKADSGGTGLGLQTCRQIVRRHGGSISFTSKPGETVFTVSLPLHSPATAL